jgi:predicted aspartyl protease
MTDKDGQTLKKSKHKKLSPILFVSINLSKGKKKRQLTTKLVKALVDTGASESIISLKAAKGLPLKSKTEIKTWSTAAGMLNKNAKTKRLEFSLPELQSNHIMKQSFHIVGIDLKKYNMIIGRNLITNLQLYVKGSDLSIKWDDAAIPWRDVNSTVHYIYLAEDRHSNELIQQEMQQMNDILDAKYKNANLPDICKKADRLTNSEQKLLLKLLR